MLRMSKINVKLEHVLLSYDSQVMIITKAWLSFAHPDDVIFPPLTRYIEGIIQVGEAVSLYL